MIYNNARFWTWSIIPIQNNCTIHCFFFYFFFYSRFVQFLPLIWFGLVFTIATSHVCLYISIIVPNSHTYRYQLFDDHSRYDFFPLQSVSMAATELLFRRHCTTMTDTRSWLRISKCDNNNMWFVLLHKTIKSCWLNTLPNLMKAIKQMMMRSIEFYDNFSFRLFCPFLCFSTHFL